MRMLLIVLAVSILLPSFDSYKSISGFMRDHSCTQRLTNVSRCHPTEFEFLCIYYCWCCRWPLELVPETTTLIVDTTDTTETTEKTVETSTRRSDDSTSTTFVSITDEVTNDTLEESTTAFLASTPNTTTPRSYAIQLDMTKPPFVHTTTSVLKTTTEMSIETNTFDTTTKDVHSTTFATTTIFGDTTTLAQETTTALSTDQTTHIPVTSIATNEFGTTDRPV